MFIRFQHLRVTPSFNLLEEFYTCFQSSFYDDNFCKNKLCFAVNSGQSIFPMIFDFGIFFIDVDTPLNLRSTKFLFVCQSEGGPPACAPGRSQPPGTLSPPPPPPPPP